MPNMSLKKNPMPTQEPDVRNKNFREVALGYTAEQAIDEAKRCLNCKNHPCVGGCPVRIHIPEFIAKVAEGDFENAYQIIHESSSLPAVCGRVCPQENQCEGKCVRGIKGEPVAIGRLERFVADWHNEHNTETVTPPASNGHKVAVIGSGPSGLTCAGDLAKKGYKVTVFEALHLAGGVLVYGIPEFRLPKSIVAKEIDGLKALGVDIETNMVIGKTVSIDELMKEYGFEAVFIGSGAGLPKFMNIPGENLKGVYSANEFLTRINLMKAYKDDSDTPVEHAKNVAVVGGGNVAMDAARCAKRLGANVYIVYRRGMEELPARKEEVEHAEEEGIIFKTLTNPVEIHGDENGNVSGMTCVEMELGEPDASGRRRPIEKKGSEFKLDVDCVIMALGTSPNPLIKSTTAGLETQKWGGIIAEEQTGLTSREGVYAGGDIVSGPSTVISAIRQGRNAAEAMNESVGIAKPVYKHEGFLKFDPSFSELHRGVKDISIPVEERNLEREDTVTISQEAAEAEARRCMNCGCYSVNASDISPVLVALDAEIKTTKKTLPAAELFTEKLKVKDMLDPDELVTEIDIPVREGVSAHYDKFRLRDSVDFAMVSLASAYELEGGIIKSARLVFGGVAPVPLRREAAESYLTGKAPTEETAEEAARIALEGAVPFEKNAYKVQVAMSLVKQSVLRLKA